MDKNEAKFNVWVLVGVIVLCVIVAAVLLSGDVGRVRVPIGGIIVVLIVGVISIIFLIKSSAIFSEKRTVSSTNTQAVLDSKKRIERTADKAKNIILEDIKEIPKSRVERKKLKQKVERYIEVNPEDPIGFLLLGRVLQKLWEFDEAIVMFNRSLDISPRCYDALVGRSIAWEYKNDYERAFADCNVAIKINSSRVEAYLQRAHLRRLIKNYDAAMDDCNKAISIDGLNDDAFAERAACEYALGLYDAAIQDYSEAMSLAPKKSYLLVNRARVWKALANRDRAFSDLNEAIKADMKDFAAYKERALLYEELEDYEAALSDAKKTSELYGPLKLPSVVSLIERLESKIAGNKGSGPHT